MRRRRMKVLGGAACVAALAAIAVIALPASGTAPQGSAFFAILDGEHEIPDADPDGYGTFSGGFRDLAGANTSFCWGVTVFRIGNPTAAHIHQGGPNTANGPIRIPLNPPPSTGLSGHSSNCQQVTDTLANAIRQSVAANPSAGYYINVHNSAFPGGAVRGQLFKATAAQNK
jgi:CHRD domain-containing protein